MSMDELVPPDRAPPPRRRRLDALAITTGKAAAHRSVSVLAIQHCRRGMMGYLAMFSPQA
jgi:hypothetical protein